MKKLTNSKIFAIIDATIGPDFESTYWSGGVKRRAYITAPAESNAYQQVGYVDLVSYQSSLSVHPTRTSRGRQFNALLMKVCAALAAAAAE